MPAVDSNEPGAAGFSGSTVIAEFESLEAARQANDDPYIAAGVYRQVSVKPYKKVFENTLSFFWLTTKHQVIRMKGAFWYTTLKCRPFNLAKALTVIRLRSLEDEHALSPATPSSTIASLFRQWKMLTKHRRHA